MTENELASFHSLLQKYWPAMRETPESLRPIYNSRFRHLGHMELVAAIELEKTEEPNCTTPNFKRLGLRLKSHPRQGGLNEFEILIQQMRSANPETTSEMTDEDVWRCSNEAKNINIWHWWVKYHEKKGLQPPAWLQAVPGKVLKAREDES